MTSRADRISEQRLQKLSEIRAMGIDPYPARFKRTHTAQQAVDFLKEQEQSGKTDIINVTIAGRVMAHRGMGKVSFLDVRDESGKIQLMIGKDRLKETDYKLFQELDIGDIIGASGKVFRTRSKEPTVEVASLTLLTKSLQPLPEKWHGLSDVEVRFRQRYLDLISNEEVKRPSGCAAVSSAASAGLWTHAGLWRLRPPFSGPMPAGRQRSRLSRTITRSTATSTFVLQRSFT